MRVATVALILAAVFGCSSQALVVPDDIDDVKREFAQGNAIGGLRKLNGILNGSMSSLGSAKVLIACYDMRATVMYSDLSSSQRESIEPLGSSLGSDATLLRSAAMYLCRCLDDESARDRKGEASRLLACILRLKIEEPQLRIVRLDPDDFGEMIYRRLALETLVDVEKYRARHLDPNAVSLSVKAAQSLLAMEAMGLAMQPRVTDVCRNIWRTLAAWYAIESKRALSLDGLGASTYTTPGVVGDGARQLQLANGEWWYAESTLNGGQDLHFVIIAMESALRRFLLVAEAGLPGAEEALILFKACFPLLIRLARR